MSDRVAPAPLPQNALLSRYAEREDCYTDCFAVTVPAHVDLGAYVQAFYTTWLFRLERRILSLTGHPSANADAAALAQAQTDNFAAWRVEDRTDTQLLLCDVAGATRSWLSVRHKPDTTVLMFGSAIVPRTPGAPLGLIFRLLLGFHKLYSRALLSAARRALTRP